MCQKPSIRLAQKKTNSSSRQTNAQGTRLLHGSPRLHSIFINGCNLMLLIIISSAISSTVWVEPHSTEADSREQNGSMSWVDHRRGEGVVYPVRRLSAPALDSRQEERGRSIAAKIYLFFRALRLAAAIVIMFNSAMTIEINIVNNHHYLVVSRRGLLREPSWCFVDCMAALGCGSRCNTVREWEIFSLAKRFVTSFPTPRTSPTIPSSSSFWDKEELMILLLCIVLRRGNCQL